MRALRVLVAFSALELIALPASTKDVTLIQVSPASAATVRLAIATKEDDPLTQAAKRAADDPYPDASTLQIIESAHIRDEQEWEQAFAADMDAAFRGEAMAVNLPFEYPPNSYRPPDGFSITMYLANAVLRAKLPCESIYSVDSLGGKLHGWVLICDHKTNAYGIALAGKDWKLHAVTATAVPKPARRSQ